MRKHHITNPALREHVRILNARRRRHHPKRAVRLARQGAKHV